MPLKNRWLWQIYFIIILVFAAQRVYALLTPHSQSFIYYFILRSFNGLFYFTYCAHVINIALNAIHCIPLFLFIHRIRFLDPRFWQYLFVLKCVFEVLGHSHKLNHLTSLYHMDIRLFGMVLIVMLLPYVPFYVICYQYAFQFSRKS